MARAVDRLVEELVEVFGTGQGVVVEVGAKSHHDGSDILDGLLVFGRDSGHRDQDHERNKRELHSSSRLTKGS